MFMPVHFVIRRWVIRISRTPQMIGHPISRLLGDTRFDRPNLSVSLITIVFPCRGLQQDAQLAYGLPSEIRHFCAQIQRFLSTAIWNCTSASTVSSSPIH